MINDDARVLVSNEFSLSHEKLAPFYSVYIQNTYLETEDILMRRNILLKSIYELFESKTDNLFPSTYVCNSNDEFQFISETLLSDFLILKGYPKLVFMELGQNPNSLDFVLRLRENIEDPMVSFVIWDKMNLLFKNPKYLEALANVGLAHHVISSYQIDPNNNELIARIYSMLIEVSRFASISESDIEESVTRYILKSTDGLVININTLGIKRGEKDIYLTPDQRKIFLYMCANNGQVIDYETLFKNCGVWGHDTYDYLRDKALLNTTICRMREVIEIDSHNPKIILTERGKGYKVCLR
jgi:hypothetical protein